MRLVVKQSDRINTLLVAAVLVVVSFTGHMAITMELEERRAFEQINIMFEADAVWYLGGFIWGSSNGSPFGGRSLVHPNVNNLVNPPLHVTAIGLCGITGCDVQATKRLLALSVAPAFASMSALLCFLTALTLGAQRRWALVFGALCTASFSTALYGSVAESYPLAGTGYAALCLLMARSMAQGEAPRPLAWILCGAFLISVTVTNGGPFGIAVLAALYHHHRDSIAAIKGTVTWCVAAVALTAVVCVAVSYIYGELGALLEPAGQAKDVTLRHFGRLLLFPVALTQSILPPAPEIISIISVIKEPWDIQFTMQERMSWWRVSAILALLGLSVYVAQHLRVGERLMYATAAMMIGFNWALHTFFGDELLLYSQHWLMPLLLLLTPLLLPQSRLGVAGRRLLLVLLFVVIWNDVMIFEIVFSNLNVA